jgi:predicted short-subunit dehydrogenase-like oxidoreductase (DUF2520 family)
MFQVGDVARNDHHVVEACHGALERIGPTRVDDDAVAAVDEGVGESEAEAA